jgi:hypothetical protein
MPSLKVILLTVSIILTIVAILPYLRDILRGKTKPNLVSWITWSMLTGLATAAEIAAGEYTTAIFTGFATLETASVVFLGLRHGFVRYGRFDVFCQLSVVVGIVLWQIFDSPTLGVVAALVIDFIGALPTFRHSWQKPSEETWQTFAISSFASVFGLLALTQYNLVSVSFPLYLLVVNGALAIVIYARRMQAQVV